MRKFHSQVMPLFTEDLERIFSFISVDNPVNAIKFLSEIEQAVFSLETMPERFQRAYETEFGKNNNIRQLLCMNHRIVYRIKTDTVEILTLRACRQKDMGGEDLSTILPDEA